MSSWVPWSPYTEKTLFTSITGVRVVSLEKVAESHYSDHGPSGTCTTKSPLKSDWDLLLVEKESPHVFKGPVDLPFGS